MAAQAPPAKPTPTTALVATGAVEYNLDAFPVAQFNRLIPMQTIRMASDLVVPVVQVVQLDVERDSYASKDLPDGHRALGRVGLRKLATVAGVTFVDERRTDDGLDPDVVEITTFAEMTLPTGQRIRAPGVKRVKLSDQPMTDGQRKRYRSTFQEHVASRAEHRAIRALLSLQQSYPANELRKPFAVVTFAPNMNHPEIRQAVIGALAGTTAALYGPDQQKVIGPGAPVTEVAQAPDDDVPVDGQFTEAGDPGWSGDGPSQHARQAVAAGAVDPSTGAMVDPFGGPAAEPNLVERLRAVAAASPHLTGPASPEQRAEIRTILPGADDGGFTVEEITAVRTAAFGEPTGPITGAQAQALLEVATAMGTDAFRSAWHDVAAAQ